MQSRDEPAGAGWHDIEVDLKSFEQVTTALSTELTVNLQPAVSELFGQYDGGACFGTKLPSRDVHAVRSKYTECLGKTLDRLSDYLTESSTLVDAAREILSRYQDVDARAATTLTDLDQVIRDDERGG